MQVASIGLIKAVDHFAARGLSLRCYAARFAEGELRHYLRDTVACFASQGPSTSGSGA